MKTAKAFGTGKLEWWIYQVVEKFYMFSHVGTIPVCSVWTDTDRQMVRQTSWHSMHTWCAVKMAYFCFFMLLLFFRVTNCISWRWYNGQWIRCAIDHSKVTTLRKPNIAKWYNMVTANVNVNINSRFIQRNAVKHLYCAVCAGSDEIGLFSAILSETDAAERQVAKTVW